MNIEQAKCIPLSSILEKLNCYPLKHSDKDAWYLSPLRAEKTASFQVTYKTNRWHDWGNGVHGDGIDLVCHYLKQCGVNHDVSDALRWIDNMVGKCDYPAFVPYDVAGSAETDKTLIRKSVTAIKHQALIHYLQNRGIDVALAKRHLKQVYVLNKKTQSSFYALGLENDDGGYELRNPNFKGCVGKKHITFIDGSVPEAEGVHIFEGMMDYLTFLTINKTHTYDVIILNSLACFNRGMAYLKGYGYKPEHKYGYKTVYSWFDNDLSGAKATQELTRFCKSEENLKHKPCNHKYPDAKDYNAWHMYQHNLTL